VVARIRRLPSRDAVPPDRVPDDVDPEAAEHVDLVGDRAAAVEQPAVILDAVLDP
jgi:hypothetical protein